MAQAIIKIIAKKMDENATVELAIGSSVPALDITVNGEVNTLRQTRAGNKKIKLDLSHALATTGDMIPAHSIDRIMSDRIARGYITLVAGSGGVGKSTYLATTALACACGRGLLGEPIHQTKQQVPFIVAYFNLEDSQVAVDRMFRATMDRYSPPGAEFYIWGKDKLREIFGTRLSLLTVEDNTREAVPNDDGFDALETLIKTLGIDVLVLDPVKDIYGGTQMTNEAMNVLYEALSMMAVKLNIAVVCCAHTRKPNGIGRGAQDQHDIKFGSEAVDTARCVVSMNEVTKSDKEKWEVEPFRKIIKATTSKTNIGKFGSTYYELIVTDVLCADGEVEEVAVPIEYRPPQS